MSECHIAWRNLVGKAELGGEIKHNLSVSRLSDLASDIEPEGMGDAFADGADDDDEEGGAEAGEEDGEYPTSLIA